MSKISQYANSVAALGTDDLFDVSEKISASPDVYESRKMTGAVLATFIQSYTSNILNTNSLTLGGNYTHDLAGNQLVFDGGNLGVVGEIGVTADDVARTNVFVAGDYLAQTILSVKNAGNVGVGTLTPDASAVLDASSTDSGFLVPRMTTLQKNAITTPAESLIVYDTDLNRHEFYNSAGSWAGLGSSIYSTNDTIGSSRVATLTDTFTIDSSNAVANNEALILGDVFGGSATGGKIQLQPPSTASTYYFTAYQPAATSAAAWNLRMGYNSGGFNVIEGNGFLRLGANGSGVLEIDGASNRLVYNNGSLDMFYISASSDCWLIPTSTKGFGVGTFSVDASAKLEVDSTTKGFLPPRMTTTQKNAITTPTAGLIVYDSTLAKLCVYTGSAWETVTSA